MLAQSLQWVWLFSSGIFSATKQKMHFCFVKFYNLSWCGLWNLFLFFFFLLLFGVRLCMDLMDLDRVYLMHFCILVGRTWLGISYLCCNRWHFPFFMLLLSVIKIFCLSIYLVTSPDSGFELLNMILIIFIVSRHLSLSYFKIIFFIASWLSSTGAVRTRIFSVFCR